jgi:hypothetical protein
MRQNIKLNIFCLINIIYNFNTMSTLQMFYFTPSYGVIKPNEPATLNPDGIVGTSEYKNDVLTSNLGKIRDAEIEIINKLVPYNNYFEDEENETVEKIHLHLPPETKKDIESILASLKDNVLLPELQSLISQCSQLTFRVDIDKIHGLNDVLQIDHSFLKIEKCDFIYQNIETKLKNLHVRSYCVVCVDGPLYYGRIWIFERPEFSDFLGMYGIRGSVVNLLVTKCETKRRGIAKILLAGVRRVAMMKGKKKIIVPRPLPLMIPILHEYGFTEVNTMEPTDERSFLDPVDGANNYFILGI